jgi:hypothetical protein
MRAHAITTTVSTIAPQSNPARPGWILLQNTGEDSAFLQFDGGAETLTSANGYELKAGESLSLSSLDLPGGFGPIKAVCAATESTEIRVQETNFPA